MLNAFAILIFEGTPEEAAAAAQKAIELQLLEAAALAAEEKSNEEMNGQPSADMQSRGFGKVKMEHNHNDVTALRQQQPSTYKSDAGAM